MSIRTFIFCDSCNPLGLRTANDSLLKNRRSSDMRSLYEGDEKEAQASGWTKTDDGLNLCPKCEQNILGSMTRKIDESSRRFVGMIRKN